MNPFRNSIVGSPWDANAESDVPGIHADVFRRCQDGIEQVRTARRSAALLIHGEAGSGKTHLLSRLRHQLTPTHPSTTDRDECLFVWVRLQTTPRMIWRTLRRSLVEDWFRPVRNGKTQFQRVLLHRFAAIRTAEGDLERWFEYMLETEPEGLANLVAGIADQLHLSRNTAVAFEHLTFGRHARDLRAWLAGDSLPAPVLDRLELTQEDGTDEEREDDARQAVIMLCALAGNDMPILIGFDQVEALQTGPGDHAASFAFGQLVSTLHDSTSNVLIVSSVQSAFATELKDFVRAADYDRLVSLGSLSLDSLNRSQALQVISSRLATDDIEKTKEPSGDSWPLSNAEFLGLFDLGPVTPRKLLGLCAQRYDELHASKEQPAATQNSPIDSFLELAFTNAVNAARETSRHERSEEIVRHGLPMLLRLVAPAWGVVHDDKLPDVALVMERGSGERVAVSACTQSNMTSLAARLKRLRAQHSLNRVGRFVILRDERVAISPNARAVRQNLDELSQHGAQLSLPSPEILAQLDAVRTLLSDAKSGDLAFQGDTVSADVLSAWLSNHVPSTLVGWLNELLGGSLVATTSDGILLATTRSGERQPA